MTLSELHMHLDNMLADHPDRGGWQVFVRVMDNRADERIGAVSVEEFVNVDGGIRPSRPFVCLETHDIRRGANRCGLGREPVAGCKNIDSVKEEEWRRLLQPEP